MTPTAKSWAAVLPVKRLERAKTRLEVAADVRADLALAMALDTARACLGATQVVELVAVTDDERATAALRDLGATVVGDEPDAGLNPALRHGAEVAARLRPGAAVFSLSSDLPALTPAHLDIALAAAVRHARSCVADAAGSGTTLLAALELEQFRPEFGPDSLLRHVQAGAVDLSSVVAESLRRDVDTTADLLAAAALGCGPATRAHLSLHWRPHSSSEQSKVPVRQQPDGH